jgi:hypothetical protein
MVPDHELPGWAADLARAAAGTGEDPVPALHLARQHGARLPPPGSWLEACGGVRPRCHGERDLAALGTLLRHAEGSVK